ncbi:SDR family oxidoreductase [Desulfosediminicola sp.]|uniref:SDR family oxidoreductase n=1 Tax=Desulfosediminicola sp. TaxID=2886825 RepID=UPI003AF2F572
MNCSNRFGQKVLLGLSSLTMRILITGGFGFIGGRLAVYLGSLGHDIVLSSREKFNPPSWLPKAVVTKVSWESDQELEKCCKGIEVVIHAAGMNAQDCALDPVAAISFNGVATSRLVSAASKMAVKRFIYLSTAHVYMNPLVGVITEDTCPRNMHPYATSNLAGEYSILGARQRCEIEGVVLRLSNVFGAPTHRNVNCWMLLVNDLCRQAVTTRNMVLLTNGQHQRDFIGMSQVCRVIEKFVFPQQAFRQIEIANIGSGVSQPVLDMAILVQQRCREVLGFEPLIERPIGASDESQPNLQYQSEVLPRLDVGSESQVSTTDIDELLRFCQSSF